MFFQKNGYLENFIDRRFKLFLNRIHILNPFKAGILWKIGIKKKQKTNFKRLHLRVKTDIQSQIHSTIYIQLYSKSKLKFSES